MNALTPAFREIGRLARSTLLGLRLRDPATGEFVSEGMRVVAYPGGNLGQPLLPVLNRSGVFVFPSLPGMADWQTWGDSDRRWLDLPELPTLPTPARAQSAPALPSPQALDLLVEVQDTMGRFLSCRYRVTVAEPPQPGVNALRMLPLFSAPWRTAPAGCAVVRTQLRLPAEQPAADALVRVSLAAPARPLVLAMADAAGALAAVFPWPEGSSAPPMPLRDQNWILRFAVWEAPLRTPTPADPNPLPEPAATETSARVRRLFSEPGGPPLVEATLRYGRELTLPDRIPAPDQPRILHLQP